MKNKTLGIIIGIMAGVMVLFGLLFKTEIKEKIDSLSQNQPAVVEEDTTQPEAQAIEFVF